MSWTKKDLETLTAAMADGVVEVNYPSGERIRYHSLEEMRELRKEMQAAIDAEVAKALGGNSRYSLASFS